MSLTRSILVAIATLFTVGALAAPAANAQIGYGYGGYAPAGYGYAQAGYGYAQAGYGQVGYGQPGCGGGCGQAAYAPIVYAQPVAPAQIYVGGCGGCGGGGLFGTSLFNNWGGGCNNCAAPVASCCAVPAPAPVACCAMPEPAPVACCAAPPPPPVACCAMPAPVSCCAAPAVYTTPAPLYVVNQGPDFNGPGIMEPYRTYAPPAMYAPPPAYPPYAMAHPWRRYAPVHHYSPYAAYHPHAWAPRYYGRPGWHRMPMGS